MARNRHEGSAIDAFLEGEGVLDPNNGNVTIETLQRAAAVVGRKVQVELI